MPKYAQKSPPVWHQIMLKYHQNIDDYFNDLG
jgi:hypothetical protein